MAKSVSSVLGVNNCLDPAVTCESVVSREFSRFLGEFHFLISILRHSHFTLHSRSWCQGIHFTCHSQNEWKEILFHFSFIEKSESISDFTLFLEKRSEIMHVTLLLWCCILSGKQFEGTFDKFAVIKAIIGDIWSPQLRKDKQMQSVWLCILPDMQVENNKCN